MVDQPPLTDILQRVFCIKVNNSIGTGFSVPVGEKIAIVTAKHVVSKLSEKQTSPIGIFNGKNFDEIQVKPHFSGADIDIAVLETSIQSGNNNGLELSMGNLLLGQDAYFLGFPYFGQQITYLPQDINQGFPLPLIKKAIYSGGTFEGIHYFDGHNNPGFSGGPIIFNSYNNGKIKQKICGVISGYLGHQGQIVQIPTTQDSMYLENSGIIISYQIKHAVDLIKKIYGRAPNSNISPMN